MKEVVMCNKNLRLKSLLKVNSQQTIIVLLKHRNFDFAFSGRGGGVTLILNPIFRWVGWRKF